MYVISPRTKIIAFFVSAVFMLIVAARLGVEEMYFMAAAMVLAPLAAFAVGWFLLRGLSVERRMPFACTEGERIPVSLTVTNTARLPKFFLTISDRLPTWLKHAGDSGNVLLDIDPGESGTMVYQVVALKRGVFQVGPTSISGSDPFGLYTFPRQVPGAGELIVYPSPLPLSHTLSAPGLFGWRGDDDGLRRGGGFDFRGVRDYQHGDELRRIHWRTAARTGKLVVAEYTHGDTCDVLIALDLNADAYKDTGSGLDSALECAIKIAATICCELTRGGSAVQLLTTTTRPGDPLPNNAGKSTSALLDTLARAQPTSSSTLASALAQRRTEVQPGSMLIYLTLTSQLKELSAVLDDYAAARISASGFAMDYPSFLEYPARLGVSSQAGVDPRRLQRSAQAPPSSPDNALPGKLRTIRKGEDLVRAIQDLLGQSGPGAGMARGGSAALRGAAPDPGGPDSLAGGVANSPLARREAKS